MPAGALAAVPDMATLGPARRADYAGTTGFSAPRVYADAVTDHEAAEPMSRSANPFRAIADPYGLANEAHEFGVTVDARA